MLPLLDQTSNYHNLLLEMSGPLLDLKKVPPIFEED